MMKYKHLGWSGLRVSELCLGTMSFGDAWGFGADRDESARIAAAFAERGGNFIDTANKYHEGQSEEIVGAIIHENRDRWVVATKYTLATRSGDPNAVGNSRKNMMRAVEASLRRLQTDYIDLYWVHAWDFTSSPEEVMRGLDDLIAAGKVLYLGISDAPAWVVSRCNAIAELRGWSRFAAIQLQYNLIERTSDRELLPMAGALDLAVTAWAPMAGGVLTGKYTRGGDVETKRAGANEYRLTEGNLAIARELDAVADRLGATSAQVAVAWVRQRDPRMIPIVGARKLGQIEDLLGSIDLEIPPDQLARLDEVSRVELGFPHDFLGQPAIESIVYGDTADRLLRPPPRG
jgi:aryl-alcohol dehydrogenase-like predicted oxidoreductase